MKDRASASQIEKNRDPRLIHASLSALVEVFIYPISVPGLFAYRSFPFVHGFIRSRHLVCSWIRSVRVFVLLHAVKAFERVKKTPGALGIKVYMNVSHV
jgi:hypothetical protein